MNQEQIDAVTAQVKIFASAKSLVYYAPACHANILRTADEKERQTVRRRLDERAKSADALAGHIGDATDMVQQRPDAKSVIVIVMAQVELLISATALTGGFFDNGSLPEYAEKEKQKLRAMLEALARPDAKSTTGDAIKELIEDYANEMACESTSTTDSQPDSAKAQEALYAAIDATVRQIAELEQENRLMRARSDRLQDDAARFDWCLELLAGSDTPSAEKKLTQLAAQYLRGLNPREAIDAAMLAATPPTGAAA